MKKNTFTFLLLLIFHFMVAAQEGATDKGVILIKGGSNLNFTFTDGTPINANLGGGYFIKNNIALGADINFTSFDGKSDFKFRPFGRYYIKNKYFAGAGFAQVYDFEDDKDKWRLDAEAGYVHFINGYFAVEPTLNLLFANDVVMSLKIGISIYY